MIATYFNNLITAINSMLAFANNPLGIIIAIAFIFIAGVLITAFMMLMFWLISQLWFRPICKFYLWLEQEGSYTKKE